MRRATIASSLIGAPASSAPRPHRPIDLMPPTRAFRSIASSICSRSSPARNGLRTSACRVHAPAKPFRVGVAGDEHDRQPRARCPRDPPGQFRRRSCRASPHRSAAGPSASRRPAAPARLAACCLHAPCSPASRASSTVVPRTASSSSTSSTVAPPPLARPRRHGDGAARSAATRRARQEHAIPRALPERGVDLHAAARLPRRAEHLRQAEAGACAGALGGEERLERLGQHVRRHAGAGVAARVTAT